MTPSHVSPVTGSEKACGWPSVHFSVGTEAVPTLPSSTEYMIAILLEVPAWKAVSLLCTHCTVYTVCLAAVFLGNATLGTANALPSIRGSRLPPTHGPIPVPVAPHVSTPIGLHGRSERFSRTRRRNFAGGRVSAFRRPHSSPPMM